MMVVFVVGVKVGESGRSCGSAVGLLGSVVVVGVNAGDLGDRRTCSL